MWETEKDLEPPDLRNERLRTAESYCLLMGVCEFNASPTWTLILYFISRLLHFQENRTTLAQGQMDSDLSSAFRLHYIHQTIGFGIRSLFFFFGSI